MLNTTGARFPTFKGALDVRVIGPNALLSPAVNVVVTLSVPDGPVATSGNAVPGKLTPVNGASVPLTRFALSGVMFVKATVASGIESPLLSNASVMAVETVLPGRPIGGACC